MVLDNSLIFHYTYIQNHHHRDKSALNHIINRHSKTENYRNQIPVTKNDFKNIPDIIYNPDKVEYSGKNEQGKDVFKYTKTLENGNIYYAEDSNTANAFAQMQKNLKWGKLSTVLQTVKSWMSGETKPLGVLPVNGVCTTYMQQLIEIATYIKGQLYNSIGLQSNWNMKRQALSENEIGANNDILKPLVQNMLMCRQDAAKKLGWTVKLNDTWKHVEEQEVSTNESSVTVSDNDRDNNENAGATMEQQS